MRRRAKEPGQYLAAAGCSGRSAIFWDREEEGGRRRKKEEEGGRRSEEEEVNEGEGRRGEMQWKMGGADF